MLIKRKKSTILLLTVLAILFLTAAFSGGVSAAGDAQTAADLSYSFWEKAEISNRVEMRIAHRKHECV